MNGRKMFDATCSTCGTGFKVSFKPDGKRPVFCNDHFKRKNVQKKIISNEKGSEDFGVDDRAESSSLSPRELMAQSPDYDITEFNKIFENEPKKLVMKKLGKKEISQPSKKWDEAEAIMEKMVKINNKAVEIIEKGKKIGVENNEIRKQLEVGKELEIELARKLLKLNLKKISHYRVAATAFFAREQYDEGLRVCNEGLEINPKHVILRISKAMFLIKKKKYSESLKIYDKLLSEKGDELRILKLKVHVLEKLEKHEEALKCYDNIIKSTKADDKDRTEAYNYKGNTFGKLKLHDKALECYDKALEINPKSAKAWYNKGITNIRLKKIKEALECYERATMLRPKHAQTWARKGAALGRLGRYEEALKCYDKALEIDAKNLLALNNKGIDLKLLKKFDDALECFNKATKIDPQYALGWYNKGNLLSRQGEKDEALKCYDKVIEIDAKSTRALGQKGILLSDMGKFPEAIHCFEEVLKYEDSSRVWYNKGLALSKMSNGEHTILKQAIECYEKAVAHDGLITHPLVNMAVDLGKLGKYRKSIDTADKVIKLVKDGNASTSDEEMDDTLAKAYFIKAKSLGKLGGGFMSPSKERKPDVIKQQIQCYDEILKLDKIGKKQVLQARFLKAQCLFSVDKIPESLDIVKKLLEDDPNHKFASKFKVTLERAKEMEEILKIGDEDEISKKMLEHINHVLKEEPKNIVYLKMKRTVLEEIGDKEAAYECLKKENEILEKGKW